MLGRNSNKLLQDIKNELNEVSTIGHNNVDVRLGRIEGLSAFVIHSSRQNIDNTGFFVNSNDIPVNGLDISFPVASTLLGIASSSTDDTSAGTGLRTVLIEGLDTNWDYQEEVITLNGQTKVNSTLSFIRINELTGLTTGSTGSNQGTLYISDSVETFVSGLPTILVFSTMGVNWNFGAAGVHSTPRNTLTCSTHFKTSTDATTAKPLLLRAEVRPFGLPMLRVGDLVFNEGASNFPNDAFGALQGKTDIIIRSKAKSASNIDISIMWWGWISIVEDQGQ